MKFTPSKGRVTIDCRFEEDRGDHGAVVVSVTDSGVGISPENQSRLFKLFGFLESTQQLNKKGVGLGLYICKQISEKFGGFVKCESEVGQGSTFSFMFEIEQTNERTQTINRILNPFHVTNKLPLKLIEIIPINRKTT